MQEAVGGAYPRNLAGAGQKVGPGLSAENCLQPLADPMDRLGRVADPSICPPSLF